MGKLLLGTLLTCSRTRQAACCPRIPTLTLVFTGTGCAKEPGRGERWLWEMQRGEAAWQRERRVPQGPSKALLSSTRLRRVGL